MNQKSKDIFPEDQFFKILTSEMEAVQENVLAQFFNDDSKSDAKKLFKQNFYDGFEEMIDYLTQISGWDREILSKSIHHGFQRGWNGKWGKLLSKIRLNQPASFEQSIAQKMECLTEFYLKGISKYSREGAGIFRSSLKKISQTQSYSLTSLQEQYQITM